MIVSAAAGIERGMTSSRVAALVLVCCAFAARAEGDAPRRVAGVFVGITGDAARDDLLVPLTFIGAGVRVGGFFRGEVGPGLLVAHAAFGFAPLFDRFGHLAATIDSTLDAAWLLPLSARFTLGPMVAWETHLNYLYRWDDAHGYWLGSQWLGVAARFTTRVNADWRIELSGSLALLGFEGRPPEYRFIKQEGVDRVGYWFSAPLQSERFVTPATLQAARVELALHRSTGWSFGIDAGLSRTPVPAPSFNLSAALYVARAWGMP